MALGYATTTIIAAYAQYTTDWAAEAERAVLRSQEKNKASETTALL
jgi:hypothetical protein